MSCGQDCLGSLVKSVHNLSKRKDGTAAGTQHCDSAKGLLSPTNVLKTSFDDFLENMKAVSFL